jgi:protein-disulfide isomerase
MSRAKILSLTLLFLLLISTAVYAQSNSLLLLEAVKNGDATAVKNSLDKGADINVRDSWGRTPLIIAAQKGDLTIVRHLLGANPDMNAGNKNGITALIAASQRGNAAVVRALLIGGADANVYDIVGWTPLMWAVRSGSTDVVNLLLASGASTALQDRHGQTALALAKLYGRQELIPLLSVNTAPDSEGQVATIAGEGGSRLTPQVDADRPVRGNPAAPVTIVEYTDLQCPYCAHGAKAVDSVLAKYAGKVNLVVKHYPLANHPQAYPAAAMFEALSLQDEAKAWQFFDAVFENQSLLRGGQEAMLALAVSLGADKERLLRDIDGATVKDRLAADQAEVEKFKLEGVPIFVINGVVLEGAQPPEEFYAIIDNML